MKRTTSSFLVPCFICVITLCTPYLSGAQKDADEVGVTADSAAVLQNINGIAVDVIFNSQPEIDTKGISVVLHDSIEKELRQSGIQVITKSDAFKRLEGGWLNVNIQVLKNQALNFYAYDIHLQYRQNVRDIRNSKRIIIGVPIWNGVYGLGTTANLEQTLNIRVKEQTDTSCKDYLKAVPH
jgi:hypothetical protein